MRRQVATLFSILLLAAVLAGCTDDDAAAGSSGNNIDIGADAGDDSCTSNGDCTPPEVCLFDPASGELSCDESNGTKGTGEACSDGSECASGICLDDQCADPCSGEDDCPAGYTCQASMVPTNSGDVTLDLCVPEGAPCQNDADCPGEDVCLVDRETDLVLGCGSSVGQGNVGDACSDDADCANNLCLDGTCSAPCEAPNDCNDAGSTCENTTVTTGNGDADLNACVPREEGTCASDADCAGSQRCVAEKTATDLIFTCDDGNAGGAETGGSCTADADCAQNLCDDGTCVGPCQSTGDCSTGDDFACETRNVDLGNGNSDSAAICTPPTTCSSDDDCPAGEVCFVDSDGTTVDTICRDPNNGGGDLGQLCTDNANCANNLCGDTRFRDVCLTPCADDNDCSINGFVCGTVDVDGTDVAACVADTSTPCNSEDDCATGTDCAIIENVAGDGLEAVCVPSTGGSPTGVMCSEDAECSGLVCLNGRCSTPCDDSNQCANNQICNNNTVDKDGQSGDFDLCETLPVTVCNSTEDCTDGVRVCGLIQSMGGTAEAYCAFPNDPPAAQLGTACARDNECRENVCLDIANECSVVCDEDTDCGARQICTAYAVPNNTLGFCIRSCANNTDCQNGNICTINSNTIDNTVDQVCEQTVGAKDLGETCADGSECIAGICLTTSIFRQGATCSTDTDCNAGEVCKCPIDQPNCTTGKECATEEQACTRLCDTANGTADCVSTFASNRLTECSPNTVVALPDDSGVVNVATCSAPAN